MADSRPLAASRPAWLRDVHRICGQLCGQAAETRAGPRPRLANGFDAEKLSSEKLMQIKGLHECVDSMTALMRRFALIGAVVDFRTRMNRGPARD